MKNRFVLTVLVSLVGCAAGSPALAQSRDRNIDYYNPGQEAGEIKGAEGRHLDVGIKRMGDPRWDRQHVWAEFDFMLRMSPNHPSSLQWMMKLCETWKNPKCNLNDYFARAVAINPRAAPTHVLKGIYELRLQKPAVAVETFKTALELDPNSLNAHYNLGLAYFDLKQYSLSNQHAQKAYELGAPFPGLRDKLRRAGQWSAQRQ